MEDNAQRRIVELEDQAIRRGAICNDLELALKIAERKLADAVENNIALDRERRKRGVNLFRAIEALEKITLCTHTHEAREWAIDALAQIKGGRDE